MRVYQDLFDQNKKWSARMMLQQPDFFERSAKSQSPEFFWLGCADSRVSAELLTSAEPGQFMVHRNIANMAVHTDISMLGVLQFSVEHLHVKHIIVCGHYGCGGVTAAMDNHDYGLLNNWLRHIKDVYHLHKAELLSISEPEARSRRLVELNVEAQIENLAQTSIVQNAWQKGKSLILHGCIYDLNTGLLKELVEISSDSSIDSLYKVGS
jgi:carbonic anhydrase